MNFFSLFKSPANDLSVERFSRILFSGGCLICAVGDVCMTQFRTAYRSPFRAFDPQKKGVEVVVCAPPP